LSATQDYTQVEPVQMYSPVFPISWQVHDPLSVRPPAEDAMSAGAAIERVASRRTIMDEKNFMLLSWL